MMRLSMWCASLSAPLWILNIHTALLAQTVTDTTTPRNSSAVMAADDAGTGGSRLDTVVVTGHRTGEGQDKPADSGALGEKTLLDTPFSVTMIDADDIAKRQPNSFAQVFFNDPSVSSSTPAATTNWWGAQIRGLDARNYYIDGVPMLLYWGGELPLEPIESVQVLKGLTGFMYGFGTPGGVIKYETKKPTEQRLLTTEIGYRNDSVLFGNVDAGGRVADASLGYRLNLAGESGDAYNSAGVSRSLASLALDYRLNADLLWYGNTLYEDSNLKHEPLLFYWDSYVGDRLPTPTDDYENAIVANSYYKTNTFKSSMGFKWQLADTWKADLTTGYGRKKHLSNKMFANMLNEAGDYAGSAYNFAGLLKDYYTQVIVQGQASTGVIRHDVVVGASYQRSTAQWGRDWYWGGDFDGNIHQPQTFLVTRQIDFTLVPVGEDQRQSALFVSDTLHFGDHWQVIAGARYNDFEMKDLDGDAAADSSYRTDAVTPTAALIFKPARYASLYGSYVESMEAGSRVGPLYANFGDLLDATISKQYEVGAKYEHERLTFTTAAFRVERAAQIDQVRNDLRYLTQDGLTLYEGFEAIGSYGITNSLSVGLGATHLHASFDNVSEDNQAIKGNTPAAVGKWQVTGNLEYHVPAVSGLSLHGSVRYFDKSYYDDDNTVLIPQRTLANAGFQYQRAFNQRRATVTGNINNIFNRQYWDQNGHGEAINGSLSVKIDW